MLKNKKISRTVSVGWLEVFQLMHVQEEKRLVQFLRSNGTTVWRDGESSENGVQLTPGGSVPEAIETDVDSNKAILRNGHNDHNKRVSYKMGIGAIAIMSSPIGIHKRCES